MKNIMYKSILAKYMYKAFLYVLLVLVIGISFFQMRTQAAEIKQYNIKIDFSDSGIPASNRKFTIQNLDLVVKKIKDGKITPQDVNSSAWQSVERSKQVVVGEAFGIGIGIKHTTSETKKIIRKMYDSGADALIDELNKNGNITPDVRPFYYPGNIARRYTNNDGEGEAQTESGINGVYDDSGKLIQLVNVKDNNSNKFSLDVNSTTNMFDGRIVNLPKSAKANSTSYTVELGQKITYQLKIDKALLTQDLTLAINPQSNLVIDDISLPYTQEDVCPNPLKLLDLGITTDSLINSTAALFVLKGEIQTNLYKGSLWGYVVNVPKSEKDFILTINAHITPEVHITREVQSFMADGQFNTMDLTIGDRDIDPQSPFQMNILAATNNGNVIYNMPSVRTSGINFVSLNQQGTKLDEKRKYLLGYEHNNQKYIYGEGQWLPVSNLNEIDLNEVQSFSGGNQYYLGGSSVPIPVNTDLFSFNAKKNRKINESLIKFIGLGQGKKYFLYPVEGQNIDKNGIPFTVYSKDQLGSSGQRIIETSIGNAQYGNYKINGLIPDFRAGTTEYNAITSEHNSYNPNILIFAKLSGIVILIIGILILLYKKG